MTLHVICSMGWAGAVAVFVVLDVAALTGNQPELGRLLWLGLQATVWSLLIPLALWSLLTGIILAVSTRWGLVRHYWVLLKLALTLVATVVLVMYTETIEPLAAIAKDPAMAGTQMPSPLLHTAGALVVLLLATILAVYKPRGLTRYGQKKRRAGLQQVP
ncbi:DUF2269 domain-containing protein [Paenarthrobacter ureafaciens]|uniref:DUF2269 domain-containing protein n=1 Tax=Paenarthrobacter ureafaciens TaxID=37931 RepID=UPI001CE4AFDF|nr:DUF2269 domain-containing protein [Paenarthrobacter ureafaciens]GLU65398.1 hypothetical protein Pure02_36480 [Paenarthrobacter ureafaciens]GLU69785.1 hypothetical protein Pure03_37610 [Paenarthrobacter ureafaciens]GLU73898.1 hypothetical protein Pure04_36130 [Paenarthrobacter ureafaciens]